MGGAKTDQWAKYAKATLSEITGAVGMGRGRAAVEGIPPREAIFRGNR